MSKATPLPTIVTRGAPASPQGRSIEPRRARRGAADGVDHREVAGEEVVADDRLDRGAVLRRERRAPPSSISSRAEVVRRRVDEVAAERRRPRRCATTSVERRRPPAGTRRHGLFRPAAVALEAVGAEEPGEGRERRLGGRRREAVGRRSGSTVGSLPTRKRIGAASRPGSSIPKSTASSAAVRGRAGGNGRRASSRTFAPPRRRAPFRTGPPSRPRAPFR